VGGLHVCAPPLVACSDPDARLLAAWRHVSDRDLLALTRAYEPSVDVRQTRRRVLSLRAQASAGACLEVPA
jgi:hypothetical protein